MWLDEIADWWHVLCEEQQPNYRALWHAALAQHCGGRMLTELHVLLQPGDGSAANTKVGLEPLKQHVMGNCIKRRRCVQSDWHGGLLVVNGGRVNVCLRILYGNNRTWLAATYNVYAVSKLRRESAWSHLQYAVPMTAEWHHCMRIESVSWHSTAVPHV